MPCDFYNLRMKYRLVLFCYLALHLVFLKIKYLVRYSACAFDVVLLLFSHFSIYLFLYECLAFYVNLSILMANKSNC